ncbi:hypothetical protein Indivirus_2_4 [Indivirus ILV1]|uniref:Uncharacterized protein n=1 Tax=Indivirus ILV1 TaxID=1977633 RepID=A0A1V0SD38_9VIRU|nr:hypothetical protein Indivirus_2_4 [Indivirus ILV1]
MDTSKEEIDKNEMNIMIDSYLNNYIEPPYKHLYYTDYFKGRMYYNYETIGKIIEEKREDLADKMRRLDKFQYLVIKHSFPSKYNEYLLELLKSKNKLFYEIMNDECEYVRGINFPVKIPLWSEDNNTDEFCATTPTGLKLCDSCKYYLQVIQEYKKSI